MNYCPGFEETDLEEVETDHLHGRRITGATIGGECGMRADYRPSILVPTDDPYRKHEFALTEFYCRSCEKYVTVNDLLERNPRLQRQIELEMERLHLPKTTPMSWARRFELREGA